MPAKGHRRSDPRDKKYIRYRAQGLSQMDAGVKAGFSPHTIRKGAMTRRDREFEAEIEAKRLQLLKSRSGLIGDVVNIEGQVLRNISSDLAAGRKLDRATAELASKTIARVDRAVGVEERRPPQNLVQVAVFVGSEMRHHYGGGSDVLEGESASESGLEAPTD